MIWTEERSRSTHENAVYAAEILRKNGIRTVALVVDAQSMRRAEACFRKQNINVVPAPSSFRLLGSLREELIPDPIAVAHNEVTMHEALAWCWYRFRGWI